MAIFDIDPVLKAQMAELHQVLNPSLEVETEPVKKETYAFVGLEATVLDLCLDPDRQVAGAKALAAFSQTRIHQE